MSDIDSDEELPEDELSDDDEFSEPPPESFNERQRQAWYMLAQDAGEAARLISAMDADGLEVLARACDTNVPVQVAAALDCVPALAEPVRTRLLVELLKHESLDVRLDAITFLEQSADPSGIEPLQRFLLEGEDEALRGRVAKLLARRNDSALVPLLQEAAKATTSQAPQQDFDLALARLGDETARQRVAERLETQDTLAKLEAIRDYVYVASPEALIALLPVLDDQSEILNLRPAHSNYANWLRACDVAVEVIATVAPGALGFDPVAEPRGQLSDGQIAQARAFLTGQGRSS